MELMRDMGAQDSAAFTARRNAVFVGTKKRRFRSPNPRLTGTQLAGIEVPAQKDGSRQGTRVDYVKPEDRQRHNP